MSTSELSKENFCICEYSRRFLVYYPHGKKGVNPLLFKKKYWIIGPGKWLI